MFLFAVGGASVIAFTCPKLVFRHLKKLIAKEHLHDQFTWRELQINNVLDVKSIPSEDLQWHNFVSIKPGQWILRGTVAQSEDRLPPDNSLDLANCLVALAFASSCRPEDWTSEMISVALKFGMRLYVPSLKKLRKTDPNQVQVTRLRLEDLITTFMVKGTIFKAVVESFVPESTSTDKQTLSLMNLIPCLVSFFAKHALGILSARNYAVAIFKDENVFYMFDPHRTGPDALYRSVGVSSVSRLQKIEDLSQIFLTNVANLAGSNLLELHAVKINQEEFLSTP